MRRVKKGEGLKAREGDETGGDKLVPLLEKLSRSATANLPSRAQTFWFAQRFLQVEHGNMQMHSIA